VEGKKRSLDDAIRDEFESWPAASRIREVGRRTTGDGNVEIEIATDPPYPYFITFVEFDDGWAAAWSQN